MVTWVVDLTPEEAVARLRAHLGSSMGSAVSGTFRGTSFVLRRDAASPLGWYSLEMNNIRGAIVEADVGTVLRWSSTPSRVRLAVLVLHAACSLAFLALGVLLLARYGWQWLLVSILLVAGLVALGRRALRAADRPDPVLVNYLSDVFAGLARQMT